MLGFWPKLQLIQAGLAEANWNGSVLVVALLINAVLTLIAGSRLWAHIFWRADVTPVSPPTQHPTRLHWLATGLLATLIIAAGLWPNPMIEVAVWPWSGPPSPAISALPICCSAVGSGH